MQSVCPARHVFPPRSLNAQTSIPPPLPTPHNLPIRRPRQPDNSHTQRPSPIETRLIQPPLQHPQSREISRRPIRNAATPNRQQPQHQILGFILLVAAGASVCRLGWGWRRRGEFELAESFNGDAEGYETEAGAEPGEERPFGSEMIARCRARVLEDGAAEARKHLKLVTGGG